MQISPRLRDANRGTEAGAETSTPRPVSRPRDTLSLEALRRGDDPEPPRPGITLQAGLRR